MTELEQDAMENALRAALQTPDPGELFTQRVLQRLPATDRGSAETPRPRRRIVPWLSVALAASVVGGVLLLQQRAATHEREAGLQAKQQLMVALRITGEQLDLASRSLGETAP